MLKIFAFSQLWILVFMLLIGMLNSLFLLQLALSRGILFFIVFVQIVFVSVSLDFYLADPTTLLLTSCGFHTLIGSWAFARAT